MTDTPRKRAVALRYDSTETAGAPEVVATGQGAIAEAILAAANDAGVPIHRDADLLALLATVELGDEIPPEVFAAVAHLISFLWSLNEEALQRRPSPEETGATRS